jgi:iron complex transport system permease protein
MDGRTIDTASEAAVPSSALDELTRPFAARALAYGAMAAAALSAFLLELTVGAVRIPVSDVVAILAGGGSDHATWTQIVLSFRLPRAINALASGAALGVCGLVLQTLFRNALADPFVLGIMHGARLGVAVLVVVTGLAGPVFADRFGGAGTAGMSIAAAFGAIAVLLLMLSVAPRVSTVTLLIVGLLIGYVCIGLISALLHFVDEVQARAFTQWEGGSFDGITRQQLLVLTPLVGAGIALAHALIKPLNALLLGETYAATMGIAVGRTKVLAFACVGLLAGPVTAYCGPIPFLGLVAAHVARGLLHTSDHRLLLPASALTGAALGLATDLVTHLPWSRHFLHLDAVIGMIGAPVALWVILRGRNLRAAEV